jgi:hypothetical protein
VEVEAERVPAERAQRPVPMAPPQLSASAASVLRGVVLQAVRWQALQAVVVASAVQC